MQKQPLLSSLQRLCNNQNKYKSRPAKQGVQSKQIQISNQNKYNSAIKTNTKSRPAKQGVQGGGDDVGFEVGSVGGGRAWVAGA